MPEGKSLFKCPNIFAETKDGEVKWCQAKLGVGLTDQRCRREYPGCPFLRSGNIVNNTVVKRRPPFSSLISLLKRAR